MIPPLGNLMYARGADLLVLVTILVPGMIMIVRGMIVRLVRMIEATPCVTAI